MTADPSRPASGILRLWKQLSRRRRLQVFLVLLLMLVGAVAELVTIGAVVPFLALVTAPERAMEQPVIAAVAGYFNWTEPGDLILPAAIAFGLIAILSGAIRLVLAYVNNQFAQALGHDIGVGVYSRLLNLPYSEHVLLNSSSSLSALQKVGTVVINVIRPLILAVSSSTISLFILAGMLIASPSIAFSAALAFGLVYLLVTVLARQKLKQNSVKISRTQTARIQTIQEGLGGIRDVILDQSQPRYIEKFSRLDTVLKVAQGTNAFIGVAPRYIIESVGMALIALLVVGLSYSEGGLLASLPLIGALAIGAQRLLPLLQQVFLTWSQVLGSHKELSDVLEILERDAGPARNDNAERLPFAREIRLDNLSFRYGEDKPVVIEDVDLVIRKGSRVGFIGKTGSGKSTLIDLIMGLLSPTSGKIEVDGVPLNPGNLSAWQKNIAHVPQAIFLMDDTVAANIAFGREGPEGQGSVALAARQAQLSEFVEALPEGYATRVGERGVRLSGGQRQRIGIARALYKHASVLILDEATSALDSATETAVMEAIDGLDRDLTILIIAHRISTLRACDHIVELRDGQVVRTGTYDEITRPAALGS
jgi:ABC-type multidrug transport system fused ATPase/permease subunit